MTSRQMRDGPCLARIAIPPDAQVDRSQYPFSVPAIASFRSIEVRRPVLFLVGENGSGKSTLLEAIAVACGFNVEGGSRNMRFTTRSGSTADGGDPEAPIEGLADALRLSWRRRQRDGFFLRAESFFNVATYLDRSEVESPYGGGFLGPYGGQSLHTRSHGESFLTLFLERFSKHGIFLLDEPEAALSPARQLALLVRMHDLVTHGSDTQFLIATHSPIVLAYPHAQICSFDGGRVREVTYHETDAYTITRRVLNDPLMVQTLLREDAHSGERSD